mmetsp:Transcript_31808/g.77208  ORF Transcript_31808/g.77208 Transcript_31808/m.77208 type:complete len:1234 (-) Transcript_31808:85-3786(-)
MDRVLAMLILLVILVGLLFIILALFAVAPIICTCILSLLYLVYLFMAYEDAQVVHQAQEYENRFWTILAMLFSTAVFFANDSPLAIGQYSISLGFVLVVMATYGAHLADRYMHRVDVSRETKLRRSVSSGHNLSLQHVTGKEYLAQVNACLLDIDQLFIPSTINNFLNRRFVLRKEKEIINIFQECDATTLNYLVYNLPVALLVYKVKDHGFGGQHRTELLQLLSVERLPALTVYSRVIVLHALQRLKLSANNRAEYWVRNILLETNGDDLSEIKTFTDSKGDIYSMSKLIFDDIRSETVRQDILIHIQREAARQLSRRQLGSRRATKSKHVTSWRKILSDVDDTLLSSGGMYPAGIDRRYPRKVVYPGVLAFYRELDLGTSGPDEWSDHRVGNLVFLSARPHVYKDVSEKSSFEKFEKLRFVGDNGRRGMHTVPSLLAGDISSGRQYIETNDLEPLAKKKFENFQRYVAIYPEYEHILVGDNGQGDVKAGEMMFDKFPYEFSATFVHVVQDVRLTFGYDEERWSQMEFKPYFFHTYPEAALLAAKRDPPLIRISGLQRVCSDAVKDFYAIPNTKWHTRKQKAERRAELNQSIWRANQYLSSEGKEAIELVQGERLWSDGEKVTTPYGNGIIRGYDPEFDLYRVELDWRPLDVQVDEYLQSLKDAATRPKPAILEKRSSAPLETVVEADEVTEDEHGQIINDSSVQTPKLVLPKLTSPSREFSRSVSAPLATERTSAISPKLTPKTTGTRRLASQEKPDGNKAIGSAMSDSSSISSLSSDGSHEMSKSGMSDQPFRATANVSGRSISKFVPPTLPNLSKKTPTTMFSFWDSAPQEKVVVGERCSTPYGPATVVEHRKEKKLIVVDMFGWKARAYLREDDVNVTREGILASLFRRQLSSASEPASKQRQFPYAKGTVIRTPFGEAEVVIPLPLSEEDSADSASDDSEKTLCLSITSWTLADGTHPKIYSTVKTCKMWKEDKELRVSTDGLFSAFGTFVSSINEISSRLLVPKPKDHGQLQKPKISQFYHDSAAVSTGYGGGRVVYFRETDGFYCISLTGWKLADGTHPMAYLKEASIQYQIAKGCKEGYPVLTNLGITGVLESVEPTTGIHQVISRSACPMVLYLQPSSIVRPLKVAVGEVALTAYGEGKVEKYDSKTDTYVICLGWGRMYAKAESLDRKRDSIQTDGAMDWLFRLLFSPTNTTNKQGTATRSRSNSVTSASGRSQSQSARGSL